MGAGVAASSEHFMHSLKVRVRGRGEYSQRAGMRSRRAKELSSNSLEHVCAARPHLLRAGRALERWGSSGGGCASAEVAEV